MPQQSGDLLAEECAKILAIVDQLADECNKLFNNTVSVNASMRAKVENNTITLYIDITFQSDATNDTLAELCDCLKGQLQPVTDMNFQQCILPTGTRYYPGNTVTMQLQSGPVNTAPIGPTTTSGATGLFSSILVIGFSYLLHFV